ncbi:MAG: dihydrolipoamide acetyltransferase family protein [Geminicoccaceae bacterium]|nr:dihydrolipoamide acetyltransferase family protein [Geminicoccaceae bacterium]
MALFRMPSLGADMEAGTLVEWLVKPGDVVERGRVVAVVETQKGAIEVECFEEGVVEELLVPLGQKVPVGTPLARIRAPGEPETPPAAPAVPPARAAPPASEPAGAPAPPAPAPAAAAAEPAPAAAPPAAPGPKATPAARRRALELGVPLARVRGTGPEGAITVADVEAAAGAAPAAPAAPPPPAGPAAAERIAAPAVRRGFDPVEMRKAIAAAMSRAKREIPHYYLEAVVAMHRALAFLEERNRDRPPPERLLPATLLLKATARALAKTPELNGFWLEGGFRPGPGIHLGWAIALRGGGLVAPAIHDVDRLSLDALMAALRDLVQRARTGGLRSSELSDATLTVTSLGERGAEAVWPVIYPPQVAIVGFGRIVTRPWVDEEGGLVARPVVRVTLAGDHRASDGHLGSRFLAEIEDLLQRPEAL